MPDDLLARRVRRAVTPPEDGALVRTFRNLVGVPSFHYDGVYGRAVHSAIAAARPDVVALELPPSFHDEIAWAAGCWPGPVASIADRVTVPFVPGDSLLEAFRLAARARVPIALIDLDVDEPFDAGEDRCGLRLPRPELATRVGPPFFEVTAAIVDRQAPAPATLAREAEMARQLSGLMSGVRTVLWIGGLAHWERVIARLQAGDFTAPAVPVVHARVFRRARLAPSALLRMTGQWPWLAAQFARAPRQFDPLQTVTRLLHEAAGPRPDPRADPPESRAPIDVARAHVYARNLAAASGLGDRPELSDLLIAASATIGPSYAARVYALAMTARASARTRPLPPLTWETCEATGRAGFRFEGRWLSTEPWRPLERPLVSVPDLTALKRAAHDAPYDGLPRSRRRERYSWGAYPPDEAAYEAFAEYLLRRASHTSPDEARSVPFSTGLRDGLDVRETVRHWYEDTIHVREEQRGQLKVTNGVIDWSSAEEGSDVLQGRAAGGWNDPDSPRVGCCSREVRPHEVLFNRGEAQVTLRHREWSLITLDCPTYLDHPGGRRTFFDTVIQDLVAVQGAPGDDVYAWFEVMCRFCAGKPFAYYSRYVPSARLRGIAEAHHVTLAWVPLDRVPRSLLERHRTFRQLWLAGSQWEALDARLAAAKTGRRVAWRRSRAQASLWGRTPRCAS